MQGRVGRWGGSTITTGQKPKARVKKKKKKNNKRWGIRVGNKALNGPRPR